MGTKIDELTFTTELFLEDIHQKLQGGFSKIGAEQVTKIENSKAKLVIEAIGKTAPLSPLIWVVQVIVRDVGESRHITLNALGSGIEHFISTSMSRRSGECMVLKKSKIKRDRLYQELLK